MPFQFRVFHKSEIDALYTGFIQAFSDYYVDFKPPPDQFHHRIFQKLRISPEHSVLAWEGERVIGFVLHTTGIYQGLFTAYNGGAGVIPERRQQRVAAELYQKVLPSLKAAGVQRILLEVGTKNEQAMNFYQSLGFRYRQRVKCFKSYENYFLRLPPEMDVRQVHRLKPEYTRFNDFEPLFLDHSDHLHLQHEIILETRTGHERPVGYIVFQPEIGRISQLAIHPDYRRKGIGSSLLAYAQSLVGVKHLTLMNVPENARDVCIGLENLGFINEVDQYEMELVI